MAGSADAIIQNLLAGTGYGRTPSDFQQQADQHALAQQSVQHNSFALQADQQAQQEQAQYSRDVSAWMAAGSPPEALPALAIKYPKQYEAIKAGWDLKDKAVKQSDYNFFGQLHAAATNGRTDLVKQQLTARRDAEKEAGIDTSELDDALQQLDTDPKGALGTIKSAALAHLYAGDPAKYADVFKLGADKLINVSEGGGLYDPDTKTWVQKPGNKVEYKTLKDANGVEHLFSVGGDGNLTPADDGVSAPSGSSGKTPSADVVKDGQLDARAFYKDFVLPHEGGYNPHDANGAPVNHGINQSANPGVDVQNLTADQAAEIFASKYATPAKLPPALAAAYNDTAFINPKRAAQFLQQSGGDVNKFLTMRRSWQNSLVKNDPDKYGKYAKAWTARNNDLAAYTAQLSGGAAPSAAPKGPGIRQLDNTPFATQAEALLTPEETNYYAEQVANGGDLPTLGMGKDAAKVRRQILAQAADINIKRNIGGTQGNLLKADLKANTRSLTDLTKLRTNVESSERTASLNMDQVLKLAPKGVAGGVPLFNRWIQAGRRSIPGDADLAALDTAIQTAANEYAAVMTRQAGSGTPTSDAARADAHRLLHGAQNLGQMSSTIRQMKIDMANRKHALSEQDQILRGNIMAGAGSAIPGQAPVRISGDEDYARLPSGARFIGPDNHVRRKP